MTGDALLSRARTAWAGYAGVPARFPDTGYTVLVSPDSRLCPSGWVGVVRLGGSTLATVPDAVFADRVGHALAGPGAGVLPAAATLGPATLAFLDVPGFQPTDESRVERVAQDDPAVAALAATAGPDDTDESGLHAPEVLYVIRDGAEILAACGHAAWPGSIAHLCLLVSPAARGRGLARPVASAATRAALGDGLLPQWRATLEPSRRVARALGYRELGDQFSVRLDP